MVLELEFQGFAAGDVLAEDDEGLDDLAPQLVRLADHRRLDHRVVLDQRALHFEGADGLEIDPSGGFFHYFKDDGTVYDAEHRHLVSSTRFIFNHAMAAQLWPEQDPVGRTFRTLPDTEDLRVIGVARSAQYMFLGEPPRPFFWKALAQHRRFTTFLELATTGDANAQIASVRVGLSKTVYDMHGTLAWNDKFKALLSTPYVTSIVLHDQRCWLEQFAPRRYQDPAVDAFARERVHPHRRA